MVQNTITDSAQRWTSLASTKRSDHVRGARLEVRHPGHRLSLRHGLVLRGRPQDGDDFRELHDEAAKDSARRRRWRLPARPEQHRRRPRLSDSQGQSCLQWPMPCKIKGLVITDLFDRILSLQSLILWYECLFLYSHMPVIEGPILLRKFPAISSVKRVKCVPSIFANTAVCIVGLYLQGNAFQSTLSSFRPVIVPGSLAKFILF